ncbi:unnamed protein product [Rotaria magnacalcarata]
MDTIKNPIFHGRRSTHGVKNDSTSHKSTEAHSFSQRMETIFDVDSLFSEVVRMEFKLDDEQGEQLFSE